MSECTHTHDHQDHHHHHHDPNDVTDYVAAVSAYRKTFPTKQDVLEKTPDPAVREMLLRMEQLGLDTSFDRFDKQQPQCNFGLAGVCCRICHMGPCRITKKSPRGVCGADADLIVARHMLRAVAGGTAQHGMHAREVILSLKWAAEGKLKLPILGAEKLKATAESFGLGTEGRTLEEVAADFADVLLADLSRAEADEYKTIKYCAPPERQKVWKELGILPISTYHEVFEAMHNSGEATDGDWRNIMQQFLRTGLAFVFGTVVGTNLATDSLFGVGERRKTMVNIGALKKGYVNIAVHGHMPTLVSEIVRLGQSEEFTELARSRGARGIQFYGVCCTGLSAMYRYNNVIPLCNPPGAELVLGTGALDLWVADVQDIYPAIMDVAKCFKTTVVTTNDSTRLPGAEHIAYDHEHSNIGETTEIARKIVLRAIESFEARQGIPVFIPPYEVEAELGFSVESVTRDLGGVLRAAGGGGEERPDPGDRQHGRMNQSQGGVRAGHRGRDGHSPQEQHPDPDQRMRLLPAVEAGLLQYGRGGDQGGGFFEGIFEEVPHAAGLARGRMRGQYQVHGDPRQRGRPVRAGAEGHALCAVQPGVGQ